MQEAHILFTHAKMNKEMYVINFTRRYCSFLQYIDIFPSPKMINVKKLVDHYHIRVNYMFLII